jgi:hypothetical protein
VATLTEIARRRRRKERNALADIRLPTENVCRALLRKPLVLHPQLNYVLEDVYCEMFNFL